jgi:hypothetical protein
MDSVSSSFCLDKTSLGTLAMQFRSTRDVVARQQIARTYAEIVDRLIASGRWTEFPGFENMLPNDWMPESFFAYWSNPGAIADNG